jgi:hypothetical protein
MFKNCTSAKVLMETFMKLKKHSRKFDDNMLPKISLQMITEDDNIRV